VVLEFELIALARQWLYHLSHAPSTFCFGYFFFLIESCFCAWARLDHNHIYNSHIAGMTGMKHHTSFLLVEMGSCGLFT
jgi:hypothetical protein